MKRILVTGGAGFIGHHFINYLLTHTDWHITSLDRLDFSGNLNRLTNIIDESNNRDKTKKRLNETIIFYESPKRILAALMDMLEVFGEKRQVCLAKEITKSFETIINDNLVNLIEYLTSDSSHQKGEFVIIISSANKVDLNEAQVQLEKILPILCAEMGASQAAKLAAKITGIDKKHCYKRAINL